MNIFILSTDPYEAASLLADVHVNKMLLESCQLLCTAIHLHGGTAPYKPTHSKHPCTLWTAFSRENFNWVLNHGYGLSDEYTFRMGKTHKCLDVLNKVDSSVILAGKNECTT